MKTAKEIAEKLLQLYFVIGESLVDLSKNYNQDYFISEVKKYINECDIHRRDRKTLLEAISEEESKGLTIDTKDLYQLLVTECRYGYKRNNHLMPDGAYDHVKEYLPKMLAADESMAIHTAEQLCDECISDQIMTHFADGEDDEFENRRKAICFVNYLLQFIRENSDDKDWIPYNMDLFEKNIGLDYEPRYNVYELLDAYDDFDLRDINIEAQKKLNDKRICRQEITDFVCDYLQDKLGTNEFYYNKQRIEQYGHESFKYLLRDRGIYILVTV